MPIAFRDHAAADNLGSAAFLRLSPTDDQNAVMGALFLVNERGEPVEFTYSRVEIVQRFLWRQDDLRRHVARRLAASLFEACPRVPTVVLTRADEVPAELFGEDIAVDVPTIRVAEQSLIVGQSTTESRELVEGSTPIQVFWGGSVPEADDPARTIVARLAERGLLLEPFDRAITGLQEVYGIGSGDGDLVDAEPTS